MSTTGKLIYHTTTKALCYERSSKALAHSVEPVVVGDIVLVLNASQSRVGPIKSCGNEHDVRIVFSGASGIGSVSLSTSSASKTLAGTTESVGCIYPEENPPVVVSVVAVQAATGATFSAFIPIANVAEGSFSISLTVDANGVLTGMGGS